MYFDENGSQLDEVIENGGVDVRVPHLVRVAERAEHSPPHHDRHVWQPALRLPAEHHGARVRRIAIDTICNSKKLFDKTPIQRERNNY